MIRISQLQNGSQRYAMRHPISNPDTWKPIWDHLVYSPKEISLDNAIGALEAHEVSMQVTFNHSGKNYAAAAVKKPKKRLGCWNCGQTFHHSSACPNPSLKNKLNTTAKSAVAWAGATSAAPLGNGGPSNDEDDNSFDK
ncbi:uncharacterized protein PGTG_13886 [Puccinia graminis f. sp. tritici CRL 75-36-700-3]|uniref:CCHC-type domain-containing protein n=1 Tax=Puccinia graminis f. sp. tritici (strain CRL 75-36-700-3 / race SCCL) TaxID=418459 RepID=E3KT90_PUCGT|nr:uncharacterized protein PGTG_13886 [Puccinia graminis f. sp. tritici CRL 75-36-700-3]EFP87515.2 hypothetical protein PGTG_13886 [Puccinia graminis f. sp. tritici CRL 75-36-700-3]